MTLKNIVLAIAIVGVILLLVGLVTKNQQLGTAGFLLAFLFGILRGLLSVTRLF